MAILIVERDRAFARTVQELARTCDVRVEWAATAGYGLARAQRSSFRGVVTSLCEESLLFIGELNAQSPRPPCAVLARPALLVPALAAPPAVTILPLQDDWPAEFQRWVKLVAAHSPLLRGGKDCAEVASPRTSCGLQALSAE